MIAASSQGPRSGIASAVMLFLNTARYLRPGQLLASLPRFHRRARILEEQPLRAANGSWQPPIVRPRTWTGENRALHLNQEREVTAWDAPQWPRLWTCTLHYFESPEPSWIRRWIAECPPGSGPGWEPYPLSRRVANWIKSALSGAVLPPEALGSLATQAEYLSCRVERRVLANHILANAKALVFAGTYFAGDCAERWRRQGLLLLDREIREQILADGGHFERSPMYHCIVLEDLLDLLNLARAYEMPVAGIEQAARAMGSWMRHMTHPDGEIAFFNDATAAVAPSPAELSAYAARLGIAPASMPLGESGFIRIESGAAVVLFDAGTIGPAYQPGHAHAGTLSIEMSDGGQRIIVNSGISTYERGSQRDMERGTAAHSTVRVDGMDQSEVWHGFRVARRARAFSVRTDGLSYAEAAHDGYKRLPGRVIHRRRLRLAGHTLEVYDSLEGSGTHQIEIFFHIHPDAYPRIVLDPQLEASETAAEYHPGFNLSVASKTITGRYTGSLPVCFTSIITAGTNAPRLSEVSIP